MTHLLHSPLGSTTVTWTVTDAAGNTAICTQTVTVTDNEDPTITCPADVNVSADAGICEATVSLNLPGTSDNCAVETTSNDAPASFPVGSTIVTWTVTDAAGNTAICTQTVTVTDDEAPVAVCQDITVELDGTGNVTITANDIDNGSNDNCGSVTLSLDENSFDCNDVGGPGQPNDYALEFDGNDDVVNLGVNQFNPLFQGLSGTTLEAWVWVDPSAIGRQSIFAPWMKSGFFSHSFWISNGTVAAGGRNNISSPWTIAYSPVPITYGQWVHLAGVYDYTNNQIRIYIDGVLTRTQSANFSATYNNGGNSGVIQDWIGGRSDRTDRRFTGKIDEFRVWGKAKSQAEILDDMNGTLEGTESNLVGYYPMEDGPGSNVSTDVSSNGLNGTLLNMDPNTDWVGGAPSVVGGGGAEVNLTVTDAAGNVSTCTASVTV